MKVSVVKETFPGERRVALVPQNVAKLKKAGCEIVIQQGAGAGCGLSDQAYEKAGASIVDSRSAAFQSDVVVQVRTLGTNQDLGQDDLQYLSANTTLIGSADPLGAAPSAQRIAETGARLFALELIPRITRAQSMDILSSMATIAGYRAVLLAAVELPKMFPLMMTAAGTLSPAKVFVIGAGVAGLQAIATAKRLGAIVHAYDVRAACREQVESLGAKFVELELPADDAEGKGGYAKAMDEDFYRRQRELMASIVAESDIVVTTAAIPGRQSPLLITKQAVEGMPPGGVIVDLAAERGGNCELSEADQRVEVDGITILGPTNLASEIPVHASQMFSNNVTNFLLNMVKDGELNVDLSDEIIHETLVTDGGEVVHERLRSILELPPLQPATPSDEAASDEAASDEAASDEAASDEAGATDSSNADAVKGESGAAEPAGSDSDERLNVGDLTGDSDERSDDGDDEVVAEDAEAEDDDDK